MNDPQGFGFKDPSGNAAATEEPRPRAVGSPLPVGGVGRGAAPPARHPVQPSPYAPPPRRVLTTPSALRGSGFKRAIGALRVTLPFVQKILPLLDGNLGTAASNILTHRPPAPQPLPPPVDLEPIENGLADLRSQDRHLRLQVGELVTSLKRVEDQLELVRKATDRNTFEQQGLLEDLRAVGNKVNIFALLAMALLAISIVINLILFFHIRSVLP